MNELIFGSHLLVNLVFLLGALRFGKKTLMIFFVLESLLANIFVLKQISLFGLSLTASDVYVVGAILALNLLQEYFGKKEAKKAVFLAFFAMTLFTVMSQLHLYYLPSPADFAASAYSTILKLMPRLAVFSVLVFLIVQKVDLEVFAFLKKKCAKSFFLRLGGASIVSQSIDTVLFSLLALYGQLEKISHVILFALVIKYFSILTSSLIIAFLKPIKPLQGQYEI